MPLTVKEAAHLQGLMEEYSHAEYETGHYTAVAYCAKSSPATVAMAKEKLRSSQVNKPREAMMAELGRLTDWSEV